MARIKYYYDIHTCQYEKIKISKRNLFLKALGFFSGALTIAVAIFFIYQAYFDSPKEAQLKKENATLQFYYELLHKEIGHTKQILAHLRDRDDHIYRTIFEVEPIPTSIRQAGFGGIDRYRDWFDKGEVIGQTFKKVDELKNQLHIQEKSFDQILHLAKNKAIMVASIPAIQPISNKELKRLSSGFGMRMHPIFKIMKMHYGIDFLSPRGTPVYATGRGVVRLVKSSPVGYGNQIEIDHGYGYVTKYAHLQKANVKKGQAIKRGECIGNVGSSGLSVAPHLHYEVIKNDKKVDPLHHFLLDGLTAKEYEKLVELASVVNQSLS